ncbi:MAG: hypothetical protein Ta2E_00500 [Mycoplasmoidaceae bacterium]|nr:MAG: hypothetical protein Ta2E_00500 [Mycoplasmoidaceae bacterium]
MKSFDKICNNLSIIPIVSNGDDYGNQHTSKTFGRCNNNHNRNINLNFKLIWMFDHSMPNKILDKTINTITNKNIRLLTFLSYLYQYDPLSRWPMKYCKSNNNNINITKLNCKMIDANA